MPSDVPNGFFRLRKKKKTEGIPGFFFVNGKVAIYGINRINHMTGKNQDIADCSSPSTLQGRLLNVSV